MKKARMILSAIVVFAVVGTALAFTPRVDVSVCYNDNPNAQFCPNQGNFDIDAGAALKATAAIPGGGCQANTPCTNKQRLTPQ